MSFGQNTLSETKIQKARLRAPLPLSNGSPHGQPAQITAIKFLSPTKQLVAQVIVALVEEQGALIIAAAFLLCQLYRHVLLNAT